MHIGIYWSCCFTFFVYLLKYFHWHLDVVQLSKCFSNVAERCCIGGAVAATRIQSQRTGLCWMDTTRKHSLLLTELQFYIWC